jgi:hypothetical protein
LLLGENVARNLYCWLNLADDEGAEVRGFVHGQLEDDQSVVRLAEAFTGESWSMGMGVFGLGDRVSKRSVTASLSDENGLVDTAEFRAALNRVSGASDLSQEDRETIRVFLEAWHGGRTRENS